MADRVYWANMPPTLFFQTPAGVGPGSRMAQAIMRKHERKMKKRMAMLARKGPIEWLAEHKGHIVAHYADGSTFKFTVKAQNCPWKTPSC